MLQHLFIQHFILIDQLSLSFESGTTIITGETGAGKSILLGAIEIVLGGRASSDHIKEGKEKAEIALTFSTHPTIDTWLEHQALNSDEGNCVIRRVFYRDGKNRCFINDRPCTLQNVRALSQHVVLLHQQHQNQLFLQRSAQTQLLDAFANHHTLLNDVRQAVERWQNLHQQLTQRASQAQTREQRMTELIVQTKAFAPLTLNKEDILVLPAQHKKLAHAETLLRHYEEALTLCDTLPLHTLSDVIHRIVQHDTDANNLATLAESLSVQMDELHRELQHSRSCVDIDPEKLALLEEQMQLVHRLSRHYQLNPEELPTYKTEIMQELEYLQSCEENSDGLQKEYDAAYQHYLVCATILSESRRASSTLLIDKMHHYLALLGMPQAVFSIEFVPCKQKIPALSGLEQLEYLIQANPGSKLLPIAKAASGGELARISLSLQAILAQHIDIPTLIFDEVDIGIGGKTAAVVGQLLQTLGHSHQVFCITHQAQVAASGDHHWRVTKTIEHGQTSVQLEILDESARIEEIARMLGGMTITQQTLAHAKELLSHQN